jgi:DNA-directed RNA polymerase subunit K/omega
VDVIQTGGPPQEKEDKPVSIALREALMRLAPPQEKEDKPVSIALREALMRLADIRLEINQLMRRVEKLEEQCKSQ